MSSHGAHSKSVVGHGEGQVTRATNFFMKKQMIKSPVNSACMASPLPMDDWEGDRAESPLVCDGEQSHYAFGLLTLVAKGAHEYLRQHSCRCTRITHTDKQDHLSPHPQT